MMKQKNQFWLAVAVLLVAFYALHFKITSMSTPGNATLPSGVLSFDPSESDNL